MNHDAHKSLLNKISSFERLVKASSSPVRDFGMNDVSPFCFSSELRGSFSGGQRCLPERLSRRLSGGTTHLHFDEAKYSLTIFIFTPELLEIFH